MIPNTTMNFQADNFDLVSFDDHPALITYRSEYATDHDLLFAAFEPSEVKPYSFLCLLDSYAELIPAISLFDVDANKKAFRQLACQQEFLRGRPDMPRAIVVLLRISHKVTPSDEVTILHDVAHRVAQKVVGIEANDYALLVSHTIHKVGHAEYEDAGFTNILDPIANTQGFQFLFKLEALGGDSHQW
ncbi:hypothetical protein [uncultured Umboniibacter sp.]|uniref:hypothetical protein n=1 Tax=uncultured Umboniibacter sp. TaxID=1798917 RepID=UPI00262AAA5E|nr:hypothetical protein [uncultured Umboniibacter sp.]